MAIRSRGSGSAGDSPESYCFETVKMDAEELVVFSGCEHLKTQDILDAPGEVVGKSSYGTLYRATLRISAAGGAPSPVVMLLRFFRPACVGRTGDVFPAVQLIGLLRHPNLVPLRALYVGPRGEKLFLHPFYAAGNLAQFLKGGTAESSRWEVMHKMCLGIARGLEHLHHGLKKPIIHGNLKLKNVLLGADLRPHLSDFGLQVLLSPAAAQEMLEASAAQGYKAPELMKMKDVGKETDIYSLGIVLLEIVTRKDPRSCGLLALDGVASGELFSGNEAAFRCYRLAVSCCSASPALRPDIRHVIRNLEEFG